MTTASVRQPFERSSTRSRILSRSRIDQSWLPGRKTANDGTDFSSLGILNLSPAADSDSDHLSHLSLPVMDVETHQGRFSDFGPRELNDDELAIDDDGDQLLVFGLPASIHRYNTASGSRQADSVVHRLLQHRNVDETINGFIRPDTTLNGYNSNTRESASNNDGFRPNAGSRPNTRTAADKVVGDNASMTADRQGNDQENAAHQQPFKRPTSAVDAGEVKVQSMPIDSYSRLSVVTSDNDFGAVQSNNHLLSPRSNGCPLSPSSTTSSSSRRSALPVPTWHNAARSKLPSVDGETRNSSNSSPVKSPFSPPTQTASEVPSWPTSGPSSGVTRPMSATTRRLNGDLSPSHNTHQGIDSNGSTSSFVRRGPARASMFERGSSRQSNHVTNGSTFSRYGKPSQTSQNGAAAPRPRSISPSSRNSSAQSTNMSSLTNVQQPLETGQQTIGVSTPAARPSSNKVASPPQSAVIQDMTGYSSNTRPRPPPINLASSTLDRWNDDPDSDKRSYTSSSRDKVPSLGQQVSINTMALAGERTHAKGRDIISETSSVVSGDTNLWDFQLTVMDVGDIITNLSSSEWNERRDGLASLQNMFKTNACISAADLKKITDIFTRMFHDPQKKVFAMMVEILPDFLNVHADDLGYWVPIVLPRLFVKIAGNDLRGSVQSKIQKALDAARETFPCDLQMETLANFMTDQAQLQGVKTKETVLDYLHELILDMDTTDLTNTPALRSLMLRVVLWASESQSTDIRKVAEAVIAAMFNVNSPEFALAMTSQPKGVQDMVDRILKTHMRSAQGIIDPISERKSHHVSNNHRKPAPTANVSSNSGSESRQSQLTAQHRRVVSVPADVKYDGQTTPSRISSTSIPTPASGDRGQGRATMTHAQQHRTTPVKTPVSASRSLPGRTSTQRKSHAVNSCADTTGDESRNDNSLEIKVSSQLSGIPERHRNHHHHQQQQHQQLQRSPELPELSKPAFGTVNSSSSKPTTQPVDNKLSLAACVSEAPEELRLNDNRDDCAKWWTNIVGILSDGSACGDSRRSAIRQLIDSLPNNPTSISPAGMRTIICVFLSATSANDNVSALASESASMLLDSIAQPSAKCQLLSELINMSVHPVNLAALQLLQRTIDVTTDEYLTGQLPCLVNSLLKAYDDDDRTVRKAGVDVLVRLYMRIGEQIWLYVHGLGDAKASFLKTRFRRAVLSKSAGGEEML